MPSKNQWTMNCLIAGAEVYRRLSEGDVDTARLTLQNLTSELSSIEIDYVFNRIKDVLAEKEA